MILYEDRDIIVCHKPAGIAVQSARLGEKDLVSMLNNHLAGQAGARTRSEAAPKRAGRTGAPMEPIRVVHRLDQPVEGVLVFAKTKRAAAGLSKQITDGTMQKTYQAVCCATEKGQRWLEEPGKNESSGMKDTSGKEERKAEANGQKWHLLTDYLVKDARTNTSSVTERGKKDAKEARLSFQIAAQKGALVLAQIRLDTGRHHQIRVQMAHAGLPLYGDVKYNADWERYASEQARKDSARADSTEMPGAGDEKRAVKPELALCASKLIFLHPITGKKMKFETEPQKEIFRLFEAE